MLEVVIILNSRKYLCQAKIFRYIDCKRKNMIKPQVFDDRSYKQMSMKLDFALQYHMSRGVLLKYKEIYCHSY